MFVAELKSEVSEQPQELGHVLVQVFLVLSWRDIVGDENIFAENADEVQLLDGTLDDWTDGVENEVSGDETAESEEFDVGLGLFWEGLGALSVEEKQVTLVLVAVERPGPHPNAFGTLFGFIGDFEALTWEVEESVQKRRLADTILADQSDKPDR